MSASLAAPPGGARPAMPARVPGKTCGSCSLCCKVFDVPPIENKRAGSWCKHCTPGKGCGIWNERPEFCQDYYCHWHFDASLGPEWRPDVAKFLISNEADGIWLSIVTDRSQPNAWRREPYHGKLRTLSQRLIETGKHGLLLIDGDRKFVILPDREVPIGARDSAANVRFTRAVVNGALRYDIVFNQAA
jgi:hypothetical protein